MDHELDEDLIVRQVCLNGQEHVLRWLPELGQEARHRLLGQLAEVDYQQVATFARLIGSPPTEVSFLDLEPAPVARLPLGKERREVEKDIRRLGERALRANRVAAVTAAGGQGTRLRYEHPKGTYPITPLRHKSLFQLFAEQIRAARRRYGCDLPWLIMTARPNHTETREFFRENGFFALGEETIHFFTQDSSPILNAEGRMLLAGKGELLTGPGGHGGVYNALVRSGLLDTLRGAGHDLMSYFQVDNPLVTVADPRFLGHHIAWDADFSCKVVPKRNPDEGLGIAVLRAGRPAVVEYCDVPGHLAAQRDMRGRLRFLFGSIATHVIDVPFAERVAQSGGLHWHIARKQYDILDDNGDIVRSAPEACFKFERFIFDAMAYADRCTFVEVRRDSAFAPVKRIDGEDSPDSARQAMQRMWLRWLQEAGVKVSLPKGLETPIIEISPLYALDERELAERIDADMQVQFPLVLEA